MSNCIHMKLLLKWPHLRGTILVNDAPGIMVTTAASVQELTKQVQSNLLR